MKPLSAPRVKRWLSAFGILALILAAYWYATQQPPDRARVLRVVDGDTLRVTYHGQPERVRLIGIDAPESRPNPKAWRDAGRRQKVLTVMLRQGEEAADFVQTLVQPGTLVRLEQDAQLRDRYGRLLAYVYLPDGRMLNEVIVQAGFANLLTLPPDLRYQERLLAAFRQAREKRLGLWRE